MDDDKKNTEDELLQESLAGDEPASEEVITATKTEHDEAAIAADAEELSEDMSLPRDDEPDNLSGENVPADTGESTSAEKQGETSNDIDEADADPAESIASADNQSDQANSKNPDSIDSGVPANDPTDISINDSLPVGSPVEEKTAESDDAQTKPSDQEKTDGELKEKTRSDDEPSIAAVAAHEAESDDSKPDSKKVGASLNMAILLAILVAIALIGLAYAAYLSTQEEESVTEPVLVLIEEQPDQNGELETTPLQSDDIQTEIDILEESIESLDGELDLNGEDLSDEALDLQ